MTRRGMKAPIMRLIVDGGATVLLMLALTYWWLGNLTHELAGTTLFVLLGRHFVNNSHWWGALRKGRYGPRRIIGVALTLMLALVMAILLVTSFAISRSLFAWLSLPDSFTLGEIHMFAAYWVMVIVGLHIGLNWNRVSTLLRNVGLHHMWWRWVGWLIGLTLALQGLRSAAVMDLWTRLRFEYSLLMWDFNEAAVSFFGHWLAILALFAVLMQTVMLGLDRVDAARLRIARPAANL